MQKLKTIYFIIALVLLVFIGFLAVIPQVIPSWEIVQKILVEIIYVLNLALVYIIIRRSQKFFFESFSKKKSIILTTTTSLLLIFSLFFLFVANSLGFGQGFMGATLEKEYDYPEYKTTIYIYNAGFLDPATAIKVRKNFLPIMKDVKFLGNWSPYEINELQKNDTLKLSFLRDTIEISLETGEIITK